MTTYQDLDLCPYFGVSGLVAVGWLGPSSELPTGPVSDAFLANLFELLADPWSPPFQALGGHSCELCHPGAQTATQWGRFRLSSFSVANLFVPFDGTIYVAPEGIGHYILCHRYQPPEVFVRAVLACPPARSMGFRKLLLECGGRELIKGRNPRCISKPD